MKRRIFWRAFARSNGVKVGAFILAVALLLGSGGLFVKAVSTPPVVEKKVPVFEYEHSGALDYTVLLKPNILYDTTELGPGKTYFLELTEDIVFNFQYNFLADKPLKSLEETYEVVATMESPGMWKKEFVFVPPSEAEEGGFSVSFTVPIAQFRELLDAIEKETNVPAVSYKLTVLPRVHVVAETDYGLVDEVFEMPVPIKIEQGLIQVGKEGQKLEKVEAGSLDETQFVPVTLWDTVKVAAGVGFLLSALFFAYLLWMLWASKNWRPGPREEFEMVRKRYGDFLVKVDSLPSPQGRHNVVRLNSIHDLMKIAEGLYKPVLYQADESGYVYCVLDNLGGVRYEYVSA